ncbi:MAG: DUF2314 domain-containing protein, partial [Pseudomonadota bacterium]
SVRKVFVYVAGLGLALSSWTLGGVASAEPAEQRDENEIVWVDDDGPLMSEAIRKARATLDEFLALVRSPSEGMAGFKLKVRLAEGEDVEHFWVTPFRETDAGFVGTLANDPVILTSFEGGQELVFDRSMISDWGYELDGKQVGSFTVCAIFKTIPKDQADYYRKHHGFEC